jgi:hypothetical protein
MTIASEITRLQWAKATARTSIINKGVDVPISASVEDYHTYIDQIQTWWYFDGIKLKEYKWYNTASVPTITGYYSRDENGTQYSLILWSQDESNDNPRYRYGWVGTKHTAWNDIQYLTPSSSTTYSSSNYGIARGNYFIKNSTEWIIRGYVYVRTGFSSNWIHTFETVYDYKNGTCTYSLYKTGTDSNLANVVTVPDGYVVVSGNAWIKSVTPFREGSAGWFYITLK